VGADREELRAGISAVREGRGREREADGCGRSEERAAKDHALGIDPSWCRAQFEQRSRVARGSVSSLRRAQVEHRCYDGFVARGTMRISVDPVASSLVRVGLAAVALVSCAQRPDPPDSDMWWLDVPHIDASRSDARDVHTPARTSPTRPFDVSVTLPYGAPEATTDVDVIASPGRVDVHILMDTTASFDGEISQLQRTLTSSVLPQLRARIASLSVGVSSFEDMPFSPFGISTDRPYTLEVAQTSNAAYVAGAVLQLDRPLGNGADRPESWAEALYQVATGAGLVAGAQVLVRRFAPQNLPDTGTIGGVGFREHSSRVVVLITDAPTHDGSDYAAVVPGAHSRDAALTALRAIGVHVVGIVSAVDARPDLEAVAFATGAIAPASSAGCPTGLAGAWRPSASGVCPLVYDLAPDGSGLSQTIVDGLRRLLDTTAFDEVHGESNDDAREFVRAIEAVSATPADDGTTAALEDRYPSDARDGVPDTFRGVRGNVQLRFRVHLRNLMVQDEEFPQVFYVPITITGDGLELRELTVRVIVPEGPKHDD
jgi:hypothetical protein